MVDSEDKKTQEETTVPHVKDGDGNLIHLRYFYVLVNRCPGTVHNARHLRYIDASGFIHLIILPELVGESIFCCFRSSDLLTFGGCILHTGFNPLRDDITLHFSKYTPHLDHTFCHWIHFASGTVNTERATDIKYQFLVFDSLQDLAKMLGGSGEP